MSANELRKKFLDFFAKRGHVIIPSTSLVPSEKVELAGTQKVLFTTAGMHPLIPYLLGEEHPKGKRLASVQKCLRTDDIDEVGDATHNTFFEMLGNWSLGDYGKKEAISWSFEFLTKELGLSTDKLAVAVFAGDSDTPFDRESYDIWKGLGIKEKRIAKLGKKDNWWGPVGDTGPCGPDTEMFYWVGSDPTPETFDPEDKQWVEIWNDVFMEYYRKEDGSFEPLKQKNVDTGMGLERALAVVNGKDNIYETDLFSPIIRNIEQITDKKYIDSLLPMRVIADHMRAAVFLIADGVIPDNKLQGYILRRLLRRSAVKVRQLSGKINPDEFVSMIQIILTPYNKEADAGLVEKVVTEEMNRFSRTLDHGLKEIEKIEQIDGKKAFDLYQTFGFPLEITEELFKEKGQRIDHQQFEEEFKKHQELSRTASAGMFKGGLADSSEVATKYHTATHLLHQALRDVLGPDVFQKGSNITSERLRFDFSFNRKLTEEEIEQVEDLINQRIKDDLPVDHKIISLDEAKKLNAIGLFDEKYGEKVSIYGVGPGHKLDHSSKDQRERGGYYSLEFCGGPHVDHTGIIGSIKIEKEEAVSAGARRIRATIVPT